ncbi:MAG: thioredoxin family protein [Limnochordaceae bacterium]|nr:thioredoxin family protein [Limnochordaceae bacterium]
MPILKEKDRQAVAERLESLAGPVKMLLFTDSPSPLILPGQASPPCPYCKEAAALVQELAELSPLLSAEVVELKKQPEKAQAFGVDKVPALVLLAGDGSDTRVRFYGLPSGYEFATLLEDLLDVGQRASRLSQETKEFLATLKAPVHLQVFVTPTCPYCPQAVRLAHQMALESPWVQGDMIEAMEFQELAARYEVMGVPLTVINESQYIEGAVPEEHLVQALKEILADNTGEVPAKG